MKGLLFNELSHEEILFKSSIDPLKLMNVSSVLIHFSRTSSGIVMADVLSTIKFEVLMLCSLSN
ncbi:hypothetical protein PGLA_14405 [Paenibacillus glacialis]|uniref:Uncharacterized protein n=1 Tax=Paenibacillus glacialis TaxID=494026 RepID=A0A162K801_9BACL|nr:hypothetical protein PGLA_14405 [Paenibacillus glacialis]